VAQGELPAALAVRTEEHPWAARNIWYVIEHQPLGLPIVSVWMQFPAEKEEHQMFMANFTCWLSSTFHIVVSFTFVTCSTALGPLACDLVS